jgi:hypothetical protein
MAQEIKHRKEAVVISGGTLFDILGDDRRCTLRSAFELRGAAGKTPQPRSKWRFDQIRYITDEIKKQTRTDSLYLKYILQ